MNAVKTISYWIGCCIVSALSVATVIWLLFKMNIIEIPPVFIFYYGIIDGTFVIILKGLNKAFDNFLKKNRK